MIMFMTWILPALLIVISQTGQSDADLIYRKVGGSIVLNLAQISEPIRGATWKHNTDLAVDWFGQEIICYRTFEGRCDFDKTSGSLTINSLTLEDSGSYIVEINNKVVEKKELQVIKPVPKPTVSIKYNHEKDAWSLTCEAQVTADFGPVTYKWKTGDTELSTDKELLITTENKESSFFCELVNPVSSSSSEPVENPFISGERKTFPSTESSGSTAAVPVVIVLLIVAGIGVASFVMYKKGYFQRLTTKHGGDVEAGEGLLDKQRTQTADLIYGKVGGSIVLNPSQISEPIEKVTWRHKDDLTSKGSLQDVQSDGAFKGRCDFDKTSGSLTINSLTLEDRGSYIVEINNKVLQKKELQVIKPVPKPTVSIKYNHEKDAWSLTCEAQVTADFGPVTYKWKTGDTELSTDKELLITTENKESSFFCELVNPVSSSSSETVENPFIRADLIFGKVGGSIVLNPSQISEPIEKVKWSQRVELTSKGSWQDVQSDGAFKGRCDFDKTSGSLTINSLTLEDSGSYIVEINNKVLQKKELQVIKPVPKPTVSIKYNHEKDAWSLTCEAQVTADFGPVTYKWKTGDTELSTDKELLITTENKESSFFCELVNPVSSSSSETVENPFIRADLIHGKVGGSIVLSPSQISEPIEKVKWRYKSNPALLRFWKDVDCKSFQGRYDFDKTSGSLTINSLTLEDSGSYRPEINKKVLEKKKLKVIKPVPKPTVSIKYNHEKDAWSLTCEAQVTADFGPVTYKWKTGDTELSTDKELLITTENKESSFFCELVNPVSSSSSETVENPFIRDNSSLK